MTTVRVDPELERFVARELRRLVGMLALYVGDRWTAEELAQDTIVRLCQHWPRVRSMRDRTAWLNRVAINLANSWYRRRSAERRALARAGPDPAAIDEATAATIAVRTAVAALPTRQRTALVLRYYAGMSVAETARTMGCAEGTVKALAHRAMTRLRESDLVDRLDQLPRGSDQEAPRGR